MDERDAPAAGAPPRHFVHQTVSVRSAAFERTVEIGHTVAHVMDPRPAGREEFRDRPDRFTRLDELAGEYQGKLKVTKVDVDANQKTAMRFNVRSIPSILFFKDGRHVDTLVGAYPKAAFEQKIQQHLS